MGALDIFEIGGRLPGPGAFGEIRTYFLYQTFKPNATFGFA
jgi:hypothetical protein